MFQNDFPALLPNVPGPKENSETDDPLFRAAPARGTCRVMCFHPRSDLTLPRMSLKEIRLIIDRYSLLSNKKKKCLISIF